MKRMVAASALAVIIHVSALWLFENIEKKRHAVTVPVPKIVTVTMSYRMPAPSPRKINGIKKKQPPKKTYKTLKPKIRPKDLVKHETPEPMPEIEKPVTEQKEVPVEEKKDQKEDMKDNTPEKGPAAATHGNSISNMTALVEASPLYNTNPPPKYPRIAIKRGYQGTTELMVLVNMNGTVDDAWLFESSGYSILDDAALQSVRSWSFTPGKQGNQAIEMWVRVPVRFQLQ
jgi:protein TonB